MDRLLRPFIRDWWGILLLLLAWQAWVVLSGLNAIVMPRPLDVVADIATNLPVYLPALGISLAAAAFGLVGGFMLGLGLGILTWASTIAAGMLTPVTVLFSSVPVVTLIPILARLFGYGPGTVVAITVIISFFPAFVFSSAGLRALPPGSADLFRVLGASRWRVLTSLALPAAMPNLAVALRIGAAHALLAAMVAEYLMGSSGLGAMFAAAKSELNTERALGASLIVAAISLTLYLLSLRVEHWARARYG
ncbi:ABC transporter permease [Roseomonas populi]|uniref:ABC transporter permease subunit n=1 Tax=Roseomonas populi TaxID=3121582 RepID=A0ABT1X2A6_9PROT|nr:ABC transporter permease subunit [Roseomonas pecuniae]MCR0982225.1 ABC transporter permease subunit [Roseomonas pecuniae]